MKGEKIDDNELNALMSLLDEPNSQMFGKIKDKILTYGTEAISLLEDKWDKCFDESIQERIENIIHKIQLENTYKSFTAWVMSSDHDLLEGYFIISQYMYPDLNKNEIFQSVESIRSDVKLELNNNLTTLEKLKVVNHIIYDIHKFKSNMRSSQVVQNHFLNNLLDTKKGSHLSLGLLYLIIVKELKLPLYGVDLPKHFLLAYTKRFLEKDELCVNDDDVLFYVNPFTRGSVITNNEVKLFMKQMSLKYDTSQFCPGNEKKIIRILLDELISDFNKKDYPEKVEELSELRSILKTSFEE